jgi:hypothetical protein
MPLPDSDPGVKSNLYSQLRSSQIESASTGSLQDQYDLVKNPVFINQEWEDEARRLKLWGELAGVSSSAGPMNLHHVTATITGTAYTDLKPPGEGMYQLQALSASVTNVSGTSKFALYYGNESSQSEVYWYYMTSTDSGVIFTADSNWPDFPMYFSREHWLVVREFGSGSYDSLDYDCMFARVR